MAQNIYESSFRSASVASGATFNISFQTGVSPVVFLSRSIGFSGSGATANVFQNPTGRSGFTTNQSYLLDQASGLPSSTSVLGQGGTVTGTGSQIGATSFYRGTTGNPQTVVGTYGSSGGSRRLQPNTVYLLQITNNDASAQTFDLYFQWYEGPQTAVGGTT